MSKSDSTLAVDIPQATCDGCGLKTNSPELLESVRKSFSSKRVSLCFACRLESAKYAQRTNWALYGIALIIIAGLSLFTGRYERLLPLLQLLVALFFMGTAATFLHEVGHAVVAWLLRCEVYSITLGMGKVLWQGRFNDTLLQVGSIQMGGMVSYFPRRYGPWFTMQAFLVIMAGPAVNLLLAYLGYLMYTRTSSRGRIHCRYLVLFSGGL